MREIGDSKDAQKRKNAKEDAGAEEFLDKKGQEEESNVIKRDITDDAGGNECSEDKEEGLKKRIGNDNLYKRDISVFDFDIEDEVPKKIESLPATDTEKTVEDEPEDQEELEEEKEIEQQKRQKEIKESSDKAKKEKKETRVKYNFYISEHRVPIWF